MILADHGARVIAVEDKRFLADGLFFNLVNRNKEHMSLNLKTEVKRIVLRPSPGFKLPILPAAA